MPAEGHDAHESADLLEQEVLGDDATTTDDGEQEAEDSSSTFRVDLDPDDQGSAEAAAANPD